MRIILDGIPAMLREMIKETITAGARLSIIAETIGESGLRTTLAQDPADVVIVVSNSDVAEADRYIELLRAYPALRVVAIASDGRRAFIYELGRGVVQISGLLPETLLAALQSLKPPTKSLV